MSGRVKVFRGDRLRDQRDALGLSQEDLAQRLSMAQPQLASYETGETEPSPALIKRMAQSLGVTTDYLLGMVENRYQELKITDLSKEDQEIFDALREGKAWDAIQLIASRQQSAGISGKPDASSLRDRAQR
jgi:transcriptional regulator with XRE-family HTH domain